MDALALVLLILTGIIAGGYFNLASKIGIERFAVFTNLYLFYLVLTVFLMILLMYLRDDRTFGFPSLEEWVYTFTGTCLAPLLSIAIQYIAGTMCFWLVPVLSVEGEPTLSLTVTTVLNLIVGTVESLLFHALLPLTLIEIAGRGWRVPAVLISNLWFASLHLVYGDWVSFIYALIVGNYMGYMMVYMDEMGRPWYSTVAVGHALHNLLVIYLFAG